MHLPKAQAIFITFILVLVIKTSGIKQFLSVFSVKQTREWLDLTESFWSIPSYANQFYLQLHDLHVVELFITSYIHSELWSADVKCKSLVVLSNNAHFDRKGRGSFCMSLILPSFRSTAVKHAARALNFLQNGNVVSYARLPLDLRSGNDSGSQRAEGGGGRGLPGAWSLEIYALEPKPDDFTNWSHDIESLSTADVFEPQTATGRQLFLLLTHSKLLECDGKPSF